VSRGQIDIQGLGRSFGDLVAVHPVHVSIGPGGITGLLGPNGAGKSTLMRMLIGITPPSTGSCVISGQPLQGDGLAIRRLVTYSPGEIAVHRELNAAEHLAWLLKGRDSGSLSRALDQARQMGLPLQKKVQGFSHGMKRMLFVIAALAPRVDVRILDEPTEGLDPTRRKEVLDLLQADAAQGTTILLSSHHLGEVDLISDRRLFLKQGRLLDEAHSDAIHAKGSRALRVEWAEDVDATALEARLAELGEVRRGARRMTIFLDDPDARAALALLQQAPELPAPKSVSFGQLSLTELYTEIYGKEGI